MSYSKKLLQYFLSVACNFVRLVILRYGYEPNCWPNCNFVSHTFCHMSLHSFAGFSLTMTRTKAQREPIGQRPHQGAGKGKGESLLVTKKPIKQALSREQRRNRRAARREARSVEINCDRGIGIGDEQTDQEETEDVEFTIASQFRGVGRLSERAARNLTRNGLGKRALSRHEREMEEVEEQEPVPTVDQLLNLKSSKIKALRFCSR